MPSAENRLDDGDRRTLLDVAQRSVRNGVLEGHALEVDPSRHPARLQELRATFVTLRKRGELRGCVGTLEARRALVAEVADTAFGAGFRDARFPPVREPEISELHIHVSVLSPLEPVDVASEAELLGLLRPGRDGLVLREGALQATFLPSMWEPLLAPQEFVRQLKRKMGVPEEHWSARMEVLRYTVEEFD